MTQAKWYGVSSGDGNVGVSQSLPDYYVKTNDPWRLAQLAAISEFKAGTGHAWALRHVELDGEADYTIYATFYEPPCDDTPDGEYPELPDETEIEDGRNWSESNGAWKIFEIFPVEELRGGVLTYDGETALVDCFGQTVLDVVPAE